MVKTVDDMAQSDNLFNLRGKIGDLVFFTRNGKSFVKRKSGGFVNGKSNEHPHTKAVQKNFGEVAVFVKQFKEVLTPLLAKHKDGTFHNQLVGLFCKIQKNTPDRKLYTAFKEGIALHYLQHISLNKHSVLKGQDCVLNRETHTLHLDAFLIKACQAKYPKGYLEVNMAWLTLNTDLEMELKGLTTEFLSLEDGVEQLASTSLSFPTAEVPESCLAFPVISLNVVNQSSVFAVPYHLYRYHLITLV